MNTILAHNSIPTTLGQNRASYPLAKEWSEFDSIHTKVPFNQIPKKAKKITEKYTISSCRFLFLCTSLERDQILLQTISFNAKKMLKIVGIATGIGLSVGCVVGGTTGITFGILTHNPILAAKITGLGIAAGLSVGLTVGSIVAIHTSVKDGSIFIRKSVQFTDWKAGHTKETYDLFLNCLKNYSNMEAEAFEHFLCPLSQDIPTIPVIAPDGHVYDKEMIEKHLDLAWARVQKLIDQGKPSAEIEEQRQTICPFRGAPFKKENLKYAIEFAKIAIVELKNLTKQLQINPNDDHLLQEGLVNLLKQYQETYHTVTAEIISVLTKNILALGATEEQRKSIIDAYSKGIKV